MHATSPSAAETRALGRRLARYLKPTRSQAARVVALTGLLGGGKTVFLQGMARHFGIKAAVTSPTFILMKSLRPRRGPFETLWHLDCYRLERADELVNLGFPELLKNPKNLIVVEWAEKIRRLLPKDTLWVRFAHGKKATERKITIDH